MSVEVSFGLLGLAILAAAGYGTRRYGTPLNPLTIFSITQMGMFTLMSGVIAYTLLPIASYSEHDVIYTAEVSMVYLIGTTLPYLFRGNYLARLFGGGVQLLGLGSETIATRFSPVKFALLIAGAVCSLLLLAVAGGGGMLWITDTRTAYMLYRKGAGPFFALTQWFMVFSLLYYLWSRRPTGMELLAVILCFCAGTMLLGSKNNVLTMVVIGIAYQHFLVKPIRTAILIIIVLLMLVSVLGLLVVTGSYSSLAESIIYFKDYFDTTAWFMSRFHDFGEFHYLYGQGWLSSLWAFVPRQLYPGKPFEYGITLIHAVLFPGAAETGGTPGILPWTLSYLDFGVFGVLLDGLIGSIWMRMAYEHFLRRRRSFFAFAFMVQFALWPIWIFAPVVVVFMLSAVQGIYLRLVARGTGDRRIIS